MYLDEQLQVRRRQALVGRLVDICYIVISPQPSGCSALVGWLTLQGLLLSSFCGSTALSRYSTFCVAGTGAAAAGGGRQPVDEATQRWWQLLPQAEVKKVVFKVLAEEEGDAANMPAAEQAGGKDDVVRVPAAVLDEVLREVAMVPAAAQTGEEGDQTAAAQMGEEGDQAEGCTVEAELLQLADGTTFLRTTGPDGKPLNTLLLRKCYHSIVDQCFKLAETKTRNAMVIGSPGMSGWSTLAALVED